jgi:hypothetical protein
MTEDAVAVQVEEIAERIGIARSSACQQGRLIVVIASHI